MNLNVKIGEKSYSVEIEDLNTRPIIAVVDGDRFEVMPEHGNQPRFQKETGAAFEPILKQNQSHPESTEKSLRTPLPGTVTEIFVKAGEEVESGQVLLVIEAMKMKNSIRSTREGKVTAVLVTAGQTVTHKQTLVEFES